MELVACSNARTQITKRNLKTMYKVVRRSIPDIILNSCFLWISVSMHMSNINHS